MVFTSKTPLTESSDRKKLLVLIAGPTGVGKSEMALQVAERFGTVIVSCDSRQIFREMTIGTAVPTPDQLSRVKHYFIQSHSISENYNAARYEEEAVALLGELFKTQDVVVMAGGSMLYIDAVCKGIDLLPDIDPELRTRLKERLTTDGIESLRQELKLLDPLYYDQVDLRNPVRIVHALEICYTTGQPYSSLRTNPRKKRDFEILKIGLNRERNELYDRINQRVLQMVEEGLVAEAEELYPLRNLTALQTVGYRELFMYFDGTITLDEAIGKIQDNSRKYARKQLTWFRRDGEMNWLDPDSPEKAIELIGKRQ